MLLVWFVGLLICCVAVLLCFCFCRLVADLACRCVVVVLLLGRVVLCCGVVAVRCYDALLMLLLLMG